jgi:hypothetical protein
MKTVSLVALSLLAAAPVAVQAASDVPSGGPAAVTAVRGKMLVDAKGARLAPVYRVEADGSADIILDGRMVAVPGSTLSMNDGKLVTSLKRGEVASLR